MRSNLEVLRPLHNLILEDPEAVGLTEITKSDNSLLVTCLVQFLLVSLNYATSALGRCAQSKFRTVGTKCTLGLCCHNKPNPAACLSYSTTLSILSKHHYKTCGCEDKMP
ncbi:hypothetical protein E2542_SST00002 [Spatholobus suberectus]|nr:hypothetical protein E2542_SST00002 [Spatholobus suberectus]